MDPEINEEYINQDILDSEVEEGSLVIEQQKFYNNRNIAFKCHIIESDHSLDDYINSSFTEIQDDLS